MAPAYVPRASETVLVHPGIYFDSIFEPSALKLAENEYYDRNESIDVMQHEIDDVKLLVRCQINRTDNLNRTDHFVSVVLRDRGCKRFRHLKSYSLKSIDEKGGEELKLSSHLPGNLSIGNYQIQLALHKKGLAEILGKKTFSLRVLSSALDFPHVWVKPESFTSLGLSEDTPYYLRWERQDLGSELRGMVILLLNNQYKDIFKKMDRGNRDELFKKQMVASVLSEIMYVLLTREGVADAAEDDDSFLAAQLMLKKIKSKTGVSRDEILGRVRPGEVDGLSYISGLAMSMVGLSKKLGAAS